jgi:niacin transporter
MYEMKKKVSTKQIVLAAMLTALSILITFSPLKLPLPPPFSATLASHVPTLIAMFISPWVAVCTIIGSIIGFIINVPDPNVALRAASHIFFVMTGIFMLKRKVNSYATISLISIVHAVAEALVVLLFAGILGVGKSIDVASVPSELLSLGNPMFTYLFYVVFCLTILHHFVDSAIAVAVLIPLERAKLVRNTGLIRKRA